jgi:hypothetical protein
MPRPSANIADNRRIKIIRDRGRIAGEAEGMGEEEQ